MAEISIPQKGGKRKMSTPRLDFTPMVDLGFILITFFIYTTTIAKPATMEVNMPSNEIACEHTVYNEESTITLIPVNAHKVVYYDGILSREEQLKMNTINNIREILLKKKRQVTDLPLTFSAQAHKLHVLIKPNDNCRYEDVVNLLDEMSISGVTYYALVDITANEKAWLAKIF